jgi:hypothetical protein
MQSGIGRFYLLISLYLSLTIPGWWEGFSGLAKQSFNPWLPLPFLPTNVHKGHPWLFSLWANYVSPWVSLQVKKGDLGAFLDLGVLFSVAGTAEITFSLGCSMVGFPKPCSVWVASSGVSEEYSLHFLASSIISDHSKSVNRIALLSCFRSFRYSKLRCCTKFR